MNDQKKRGRPAVDDVLTPAEWRVVSAAQHGLTNPEIAERLGVSVNAVKFHIANAVAKLQQPNKKSLLTWLGAPKGSLLDLEGVGKSKALIDAIGQIARSVSDLELSTQWYSSVLGLEHLYTFGSMAFFQCGATRLMLNQTENGVQGESILYFRTDDIKAMYEGLIQRGVEFSNAPHRVHTHEDGSEEWMAFLLDPDRRPIGLMAVYSA